MSTTATLEKQILARACVDPAYRSKARPYLERGGCFSHPAIAWVWRTLCTLPTNDAVTRSAMMALVELNFQHDQDASKEELHANMVDAVFEHASNPDLVSLASVEVLAKLESHARLEGAVVEASKLLDSGDVDGAWSKIQSLRRQNLRSSGMRRIDYAASIPDRVEAMRNQVGPAFIYIPTMIPGIDKYIDGLRLTELGIIGATTNRGKTICALNFAAAAATQGFVTAVFNTEMLVEQCAMRLDSHFTKQEHRKFKTWGFTSEEEEQLFSALDLRIEQLQRRLFLFDTPIRECRLQMVENEIRQLEDDLGEAVRLAVIDSPAHFKSERRYEQKRFEASDIFWELKAMARGEGEVDHPLALWVTDNLAKEYEDKLAGAGSTSESYDKSRIADILVTLNQTHEQEVNREMILNLAKVRDSEARAQVLVRLLFKIMAFEQIGEVDRRNLIKDATEDGSDG